MRKLLFSFIALLPISAFAQWSGSTDLTTPSKVGIGMTTTPITRLQVVDPDGGGSASTTLPLRGILLTGASTSGSLNIGIDGTTTYYSWLQSRSKTSAAYYNLSLNPAGGNVGVGSTNPLSKLYVEGGSPGGNISLYVNGGGRFGGAATIGRSGTQYDEFGYNVNFTSTSDQYRYLAADAAASIRMGWSGDIEFRTAPSGTAGAALTLNTRMRLKENGNLGIGTTNAGYKLDIYTTANYDGIQLQYASSSWTRLYARMAVSAFNNITGEGDAGIIFGSPSGINTGSGGFVIAPHRSDFSGLRVTPTGMVGIGTGDTKGYRLAVAGKIISEEVVVKSIANWPDYVFDPSYTLPNLSELEQFIQKNKHLPGVPTAEEAKTDGVTLGEMNRILLEKVEELTLLLIQQNKELQLQKEQIKSLLEK